MTGKRVFAAIIVFAFIYLFDFIFHTICLKDLYMETAPLWRPETDMHMFKWWLWGGEFLYALAFFVLFIGLNVASRNIKGGIEYGLWMGIFSAGMSLIFYAVQPLPLTLAVYWVIGDLFKFSVAGGLAALVLRPKMGY